jgi:predicted site-specific integrase-resolvase
MPIYIGNKKRYTTAEVAELNEICLQTLLHWIRRGLRAPQYEKIGEITVRLWTAADLKRVGSYKKEHYWKGWGRPTR